jgi:phage terminase large subunit-like protein
VGRTTRSPEPPKKAPARRAPAKPTKPAARRSAPAKKAAARARQPPDLERLKISPEVAYYMESRGIPLPDCPPLIKTPEPRLVRGAAFDPERVDVVLRTFMLLRHTQGRWAGKPLKPDPWQVAYILAPVYGWVRRDPATKQWVRIIRTEYVEVPRKNGKTTLSGGQAAYLTTADGEAGAQVIAAAAGKEQAGYCFNPVKLIAEKSPALAKHVKVTAFKIVHKRTGSYFTVVSSVADLLHGANVHGAVVDELHVHKNRETVDAIETGTGARQQPLVVFITTADDGKPGTIYAEKRLYVEQLARGVIKDASFYGVVFAAEKDDPPFAEATWKKANPGYGISPTKAFLEAEARKAKQSPANLSRFLRLHLGIRTKQETKYVGLDVWDASAGLVDETALEGRPCRGGLDLASVEDLTALCWTFPDGEDGVDVLWRFWLPEDRLPDLSRRTAGAADVWVREGWLKTTPGNVIDNDAIKLQVLADAERFDVQTIGYDRWGSSDLVRRLGDELGSDVMVPVGQGFATMSAPLKETLRLLLSKRYRHGGNPVMRWMTDNLAVSTDPSGNVKPDKARAADKIDGWSAAMNAMAECLAGAAGDETSIYEDQDFEVG